MLFSIQQQCSKGWGCPQQKPLLTYTKYAYSTTFTIPVIQLILWVVNQIIIESITHKASVKIISTEKRRQNLYVVIRIKALPTFNYK